MANIISAGHPQCVEEAVHLLRAGEIICYPTDTVYGIGAAASNDAAVRRLFAVKGRSPGKPLPLLVADAAGASLVADVSPLGRKLMSRFWPGALTLVLRKLDDFRSVALAGQDTVALRVPDHSLLREIISLLREPVIGTSANRAGARPPVTAAEAAFQLGDMVALVIDGGRCRQGRESTVLDITLSPPRILREGPVGREAINEALDGKEVA